MLNDEQIFHPKSIMEPRYHERYFSYAVPPDDISDRELEELIKAAEDGPQDEVDRLVNGLARERIDKLVDRMAEMTEKGLVWKVPVASRLAIALAKVGYALRPEAMPGQVSMVATLAGVIALLCGWMVELFAEEGHEATRSVVACATPLPFAIMVFVELDRIPSEKLWVAGLPAGLPIKPQFQMEALRGVLLDRIREEAQVEPAFTRYPPQAAFSVMQFWNSAASEEERGWLEGRLREHPAEAAGFLGTFAGQPENYQSVVEMASAEVIAAALEGHFGADLRNPDTDSEELRRAREFLVTHKRKTQPPAGGA